MTLDAPPPGRPERAHWQGLMTAGVLARLAHDLRNVDDNTDPSEHARHTLSIVYRQEWSVSFDPIPVPAWPPEVSA